MHTECRVLCTDWYNAGQSTFDLLDSPRHMYIQFFHIYQTDFQSNPVDIGTQLGDYHRNILQLVHKDHSINMVEHIRRYNIVYHKHIDHQMYIPLELFKIILLLL